MKNYKLRSLLLSFFFLALLVGSCENNHFEEAISSRIEDIEQNAIHTIQKDTLSHWVEQLRHVQKGSLKGKLDMMNLELKSFTVLKANIYQKETNDAGIKSNYPLYYGDNQFRLVNEIHLSEQDNKKYKEKKHAIISEFSDADLRQIQFTWNYEGNLIKSNAFVSIETGGIVYDDILSNLIFIEIDHDKASKPSTNHRILSGATDDGCYGRPCDMDDECYDPNCSWDDEGDEPDGPVKFEFSSPRYSIKNWLGREKASASCYIIVYGDRQGGNIEMTHYTYSTYYDADLGYSADAQLIVTHFEEGQSGFCEYTYGIMVGEQPGLSLGINGYSITLPSGTMGQTGGGYISSIHLK